jgi:hypothetical protein
MIIFASIWRLFFCVQQLSLSMDPDNSKPPPAFKRVKSRRMRAMRFRGINVGDLVRIVRSGKQDLTVEHPELIGKLGAHYVE